MPFAPRGAVARWRTIYDMLLKMEVDDVITFEEMGRELALHPFRDRMKIVSALKGAAQKLEEENKRAMEKVPNVGYRLVAPQEQLRLARVHQNRAVNSLERAQSKVVNVNVGELDPETRKGFEVFAAIVGAQLEVAHRLEQRTERIEEVLAEVVHVQRDSRTNIDDIRERLARLEAREH
jgi:hypothetical protein